MNYFRKLKAKILKFASNSKIKGIIYVLFVMVFAASFTLVINKVKAEQSGGSPESGVTSRIKTLYDELFALSYGADVDAPDWSAYWNRIKTAAKWVPNGTVTVTDVKNGITFYDDSRVQKTGTYPNPSTCPNQQWYDSHASATPENNCNLAWTDAAVPIVGEDDNISAPLGGRDPRTGLIWSQYLKRNAVSHTVEFAAAGGNDWSWDGTTDADSIDVGGKTASQLCSERGNGWRLPSEKELMQAYIDGSFWNLTNPAYYFWSRTETSATFAYYTYLVNGVTSNGAKTNSFYVRCVR